MNAMKKKWISVLSIILWLLCGCCLGLCIVFTVDLDKALGESVGSFLVLYGLYIFLSVIAFVIQLIIHETGHLVFGLLSGYGFSSFRIGSINFTKKDGKLTVWKKSVPGTAGQCLLSPPDYNGGDFPYIMYNLGGVFLNLIASFIFALLFIAVKDVPIINTVVSECVVIGVFYALFNGIPMQTKDIPNDGYNALHTGDNALSKRSFWTELKISELSYNGERIKDMPDELFYLPSREENVNALVCSSAIFYENRLMDMEKYEEANELCHTLLEDQNDLPGIYRNPLTIDRISTDIILQNGKCTKEELEEPKMAEYLKKLSVSLEVLRTRYIISLLLYEDEAGANKWLSDFDKMAKDYPNAGDIELSRQIMRKAQEQKLLMRQ